jgi:hypothetical protein
MPQWLPDRHDDEGSVLPVPSSSQPTLVTWIEPVIGARASRTPPVEASRDDR